MYINHLGLVLHPGNIASSCEQVFPMLSGFSFSHPNCYPMGAGGGSAMPLG